MTRPRAKQVCSTPGCPRVDPCPDHHHEPWTGSTRRSRLPRNWATLRARVIRRDTGRCQRCGAPANQVDHITPGDDHSMTNLQLLCGKCHGAKTQTEAVMARRRLTDDR